MDITSKRFDVCGQLNTPIKGIDKVKLGLTHADYYHDEKDAGNPERNTGIAEGLISALDRGHAAAIFKNVGNNTRLEVYHTPTDKLRGLVGVQYQKQDLSASTPYLPSYGATTAAIPRHLLVPHSDKNLSVFGLEQFKFSDVTLELAVRHEKQKTPVHYDRKLLDYLYEWHKNHAPALKPPEPSTLI